MKHQQVVEFHKMILPVNLFDEIDIVSIKFKYLNIKYKGKTIYDTFNDHFRHYLLYIWQTLKMYDVQVIFIYTAKRNNLNYIFSNAIDINGFSEWIF